MQFVRNESGEDVVVGCEPATQPTNGIDPLWTPLLCHYEAGLPGRIDVARMAAQIRFLRPHLKQFLFAGSTGDGWEVMDDAVRVLVSLAKDSWPLDRDCRVLFGALRATTNDVIARATAIEQELGGRDSVACEVVGLAICPPIDPNASQSDILEHYNRVIDEASLPIAVYQLPQVTRCSIAPETMSLLAAHPRVVMFKDSSGEDVVADAGAASDVLALRGAEGDYAGALAPRGPYGGWLLSSGNALPQSLRRVADALSRGDAIAAETESAKATRAVERLFAAVRDLSFGNAFSNANRAADHVLAFGARWPEAKAISVSGAEIPVPVLAEAATVLAEIGEFTGAGYLGR